MREKSTSTPLTLTTLPDANGTGAGVSSDAIEFQLDIPTNSAYTCPSSASFVSQHPNNSPSTAP